MSSEEWRNRDKRKKSRNGGKLKRGDGVLNEELQLSLVPYRGSVTRRVNTALMCLRLKEPDLTALLATSGGVVA